MPIGRLFRRERIVAPSACDPGGFRTIVRGKHRIVVCCPKGQYDKRHRICRAGMRAQAVEHPKRQKGHRAGKRQPRRKGGGRKGRR